jgi:hypothetical protein
LLPILYGFHSRCPQVASIIKKYSFNIRFWYIFRTLSGLRTRLPSVWKTPFLCVLKREKNNYLFIFWVILLHRWAGIHHPSCIQHTSSRNPLIILVTILGEIYTYIYVVVIVLGLGIWYIKEEKIVRDLFK